MKQLSKTEISTGEIVLKISRRKIFSEMNIGLEYDNLLPPYSEYFKLRLELKQAFIKELLFIRNIADWICKGIEKLNKNNLDTA